MNAPDAMTVAEPFHVLIARCWSCNNEHRVDLKALILAGRGNQSFAGRKWRCQICQRPGSVTHYSPPHLPLTRTYEALPENTPIPLPQRRGHGART